MTIADTKYVQFLKKSPKKRIAVGVLLFNSKNEILILKPGYKDSWLLPGGIVEKHESPIEAARREIQEELNINVNIVQCVCIDFLKGKISNYTTESLQFLFLGDFINMDDIKNIKVDSKEIIKYKFVNHCDAINFLGEGLSKRLNSLNGNYNKFVFMENGITIL